MTEKQEKLVASYLAIKVIRRIGTTIRFGDADSTSRLNEAEEELRNLSDLIEQGALDGKIEPLSEEEEIAAEIARGASDIGAALEALAAGNDDYLIEELRAMKTRADRLINKMMEKKENG